MAASAAAGGGTLPCEVSQLMQTNCGACHGATPSSGAPMSLVTYADLLAPARSDATKKVHELVALRIEDRARPMPPDPTKRLSDQAIAQFRTWSSSGAQAGSACTPAQTAATGGAAGGPAVTEGIAANGGDKAADIEECFELHAHGQPTVGDKSPYMVPNGENYSIFTFKAPWTKPVQGLRFRHLADNPAVVHHWLLFAEHGAAADGSIAPCDLAGPAGILCGAADTRSLITGWAPGRPDFSLPPDVGLEMPAPGELLAVELHYFNTANAMASDRSGVEICTSSKFRKNTASVSWLGTETIDVPPNSMGTAAGTCTPDRAGMNPTDPINVLFSWPHMHKAGTHLKSVVNRAAGGSEVMYEGPFSFEFQTVYDTPLKLLPGDTVTTTCTYQNSTNLPINFGQSTTAEMCFNFTYAWPAHALDHPGGAIGSSPNSCFH
jgi:cytochrome c553